MIGSTISHYKILEKLGEGGMGVVYKAEDLKLKRIVAIKFLPKRLAVHGEERERFEHEAQAASSLNHPNICTIYEIDEQNDETFIVMEYLDGVTLREWIRKKAEQSEGYRKLGAKEAVELATQIAEGLEKAHEKGIIHRDIKSENIMVTNDGRAKIMDFGLAKLRGASKLTKTGSTVGTIAYMSPEQVEGMETDHRTDIFSFGVVLYEMLSGRLPFQAEHETAMMYEIINVEPKSVSEIRQGVDSELDRIVMKCLEKDREIRYQSMRDVVVDLKRYRRDSEGRRIERTVAKTSQIVETIPVESQLPSKRSHTAFIIGGIVLIIMIVAGIFYFQKQSVPLTESKQLEAKIAKITSRPGLEDEPSWSPDGKFLAYTSDDRGNFDILVQPVTGGQIIRVGDSDADDAQPAWSPDGTKLAFVSARDRGGRFSILMGEGLLEAYLKGKGGDIFLVPALGGTPVKLVENGFDPAWSPDGKTIVFRSSRGGQWDLWTIPVEGGTPKQFTNDASLDYQPCWSPDGKWIVYGYRVLEGGFEDRDEVYAVQAPGRQLPTGRIVDDSSSGTGKKLTNDAALVVKPTWSPDGKFIVFSSKRSGSMNIWKILFNPESKDFASPVRVTIGEGDDVNVSAALSGGKLAYATVKSSPDIWELTVVSGKLRQVSFETGLEDNPNLSPDGKTLLIQSDRSGTVGIWTMDLNGNFLSQLTSDKSDNYARWSPDARRFIYTRSIDGKNTVMMQSLGSISATKVMENAFESEWSPDGKKLVATRMKDNKSSVWIHSLENGDEKQLTPSEWNCVFPNWTADGNWIAFNVQKGNTRHIWIVPSSGRRLPTGRIVDDSSSGTPRQITFGEAEYSHPQLSRRDKDIILCLKDHKNVCLVSISTGKITQLTNLTESSINLIDYPTWSPDGQKVYISLFRKSGDLYILENY